MAKLSKTSNRIISILCIVLFLASIISASVMGYEIYKNYIYNEELTAEQQKLKDEYEAIQEIYEDVDENGYYNVYSDGESIIYEDGGVIIFS